MRYGYVRKNYPIETLVQIEKLGEFECEYLFIEDANIKTSAELNELLSKLNKGDTIFVTNLLVFGKLINELQVLINQIVLKGARIVSIEEQLDTDSQYSIQKILNIFIYTNKKIVSDRTIHGLNEVKKNGKNLGRPKIDSPTIDLIINLRKNQKLSLRKIAEISGVSVGTAAKYVKDIRV